MFTTTATRRGVSKAEDCYDPLRLESINQGNGKFATIDVMKLLANMVADR